MPPPCRQFGAPVCLGHLLALVLALALRGEALAKGDGDELPSFRRDVMAVLSKAGCASGACHGNRAGKGGLKLSLRGEDPDSDYQTLLTGLGGRRLNFNEPAQSLLLLKPTTDVAHEGGRPTEVRLTGIRHAAPLDRRPGAG